MAADGKDQNERSVWQKFKDGFKPVAVRADIEVQENKGNYGDQWQADQELSPMARRLKIQKGFEGYGK